MGRGIGGKELDEGTAEKKGTIKERERGTNKEGKKEGELKFSHVLLRPTFLLVYETAQPASSIKGEL